MLDTWAADARIGLSCIKVAAVVVGRAVTLDGGGGGPGFDRV